MEAALGARLRARGFERECERLRPLGVAYVLRRFGGSLNRADAEDAVAEVLIRLHRQAAAGRTPQNLRAAFFTSVHNAAIDALRTRAAKPTVALEAAVEEPAANLSPAERAESREDAVRLQEALGRMRPNYREAILMRFGLGLTVPEIAANLQISLPAAKKLVLRATRQVRERLGAIEGEEFCPEMRDLARRSLFEKEASGLASEAEARVLHAHFEHCGSCRSFLISLRGAVHDLGAAAVLDLVTADRSGLLGHLARWSAATVEAAQAGAARVRHLAYKATGALQPGDAGTAGALAGTGQKIAAICTAGATATATCLLTGAIGPGLGAAPAANHAAARPAARIRAARERPDPLPSSLESSAPESPPAPEPPSEPVGGSGPRGGESASAPPSPPAPAAPAASAEPEAPPPQFGVESSAPSSSAAASTPPSSARSTGASSGGAFSGAGGSGSSGSGSSGAGVGFQG